MNGNIEIRHEEFKELCENGQWEEAQAMIDELWDSNPVVAEELRRYYLARQAEWEVDFTFEPVVEEVPPVLEAAWFEGTPKEYEESEHETFENAHAVYQAYKARVSNEG